MRVRWGWIVAAGLLGIALAVASTFTQGACYDSATDPAASFCTSEPLLTAPGLIAAWTVWLGFTAFAVWRATRPRGDAR